MLPDYMRMFVGPQAGWTFESLRDQIPPPWETVGPAPRWVRTEPPTMDASTCPDYSVAAVLSGIFALVAGAAWVYKDHLENRIHSSNEMVKALSGSGVMNAPYALAHSEMYRQSLERDRKKLRLTRVAMYTAIVATIISGAVGAYQYGNYLQCNALHNSKLEQWWASEASRFDDFKAKDREHTKQLIEAKRVYDSWRNHAADRWNDQRAQFIFASRSCQVENLQPSDSEFHAACYDSRYSWEKPYRERHPVNFSSSDWSQFGLHKTKTEHVGDLVSFTKRTKYECEDSFLYSCVNGFGQRACHGGRGDLIPAQWVEEHQATFREGLDQCYLASTTTTTMRLKLSVPDFVIPFRLAEQWQSRGFGEFAPFHVKGWEVSGTSQMNSQFGFPTLSQFFDNARTVPPSEPAFFSHRDGCLLRDC